MYTVKLSSNLPWEDNLCFESGTHLCSLVNSLVFRRMRVACCCCYSLLYTLISLPHYYYFCYHLRIITVGSNLYASQKGMRMGASRHAADIRADKPSKESQTILHLQSGELSIFAVAVYLYDLEAKDVPSSRSLLWLLHLGFYMNIRCTCF